MKESRSALMSALRMKELVSELMSVSRMDKESKSDLMSVPRMKNESKRNSLRVVLKCYG